MQISATNPFKKRHYPGEVSRTKSFEYVGVSDIESDDPRSAVGYYSSSKVFFNNAIISGFECCMDASFQTPMTCPPP